MTEIKHPSAFPVSPLMNALSREADQTIIEMVDGRSWTGAEVRDTINRLTHALAAKGVGPGTRVSLLAGNSVEVIFLHNAIGASGACMVAMHPMGSLDDHLFAIEDAGVDTLVFDPTKFTERATALSKSTNRLTTLLSVGPAEVGEDLIELASAKTADPFPTPPADEKRVSRISYSGGTTGTPKPIPGSPRVAAASQQIILSEWEWPIEPRTLAVVPLSHAGGTLFAPTLLKHGKLIVMPSFDAGKVLEAIERYRITCTMLVPTMIYALLDHPDLEKRDLSSLETVFYGASLMSPARLKEAVERIGPVFFQFYGQAEAPMTVTVMRRSEHDPNNPARMASCGRPVPWVNVALLDDDNQEVPDGEPGEICVRGNLVMEGYLGRDELNRETFAGGWLHTGDVAIKDPDGFLRIVDRKKDMIVTGGFNVFPSEVENVIGSHPAVSQVSVFGVPHDKWGEAVTAAVVLRPGAEVAAEHLVRLVREHKGPVQAPKRVEFLDAIPQTAVGKPDKKALRARFAEA